MKKLSILLSATVALTVACSHKDATIPSTTRHTIAVVDPGHFHAALVSKSPLVNINDTIHLFAPRGAEVGQYISFLESYNSRDTNPTSWIIDSIIGDSYLEAFKADTLSDIVVLAGNNRHKTDYIMAAVEAGKNVLADKPMAIDQPGFETLAKAYAKADSANLTIYELMTERYDTINILTRQLLADTTDFGTLITDSAVPAIEMESTHHFYKEVSGSPLIRPEWYYDVEQQGEGIADVTTHLIDLIMWQCFPGQPINYETDVEVIDAAHDTTVISPEQFLKSTGKSVNKPVEVFSNGYIVARINNITIKLGVHWNYEAPQGTGDTFQAIYRGTKGTIEVVQDASTSFSKELYSTDSAGNRTHHEIPDADRLGHEDHFNRVTATFLDILDGTPMPQTESANTLAKYKITTDAVAKARNKK